jgi:hypothetical protein
MNRATFRRWADGPAVKFGLLAAGAGALVLMARRQAEQEERLVSPPSPPVTAFALRNERCGIVPYAGRSVPRLEFEVDVPANYSAMDLRATVVGSRGERLSLSTIPKNPAQAAFTRFGYAASVANPRLVVMHKAKKVFEHPVAPLPPPVRAIPLVLAVDPVSRLEVVPRDELERLTAPYRTPRSVYYSDLAKRPPGSVFRLTPPLSRDPGAHASPKWNEWGSAGSFSFPTTTGESLFWMGEPGQQGSLAEVAVVRSRRTERIVEPELEIELVEKDGQPGIRVVRPMRQAFPDGLSVEIPAQERWPTSASRGRPIRHVSLRTTEVRSATKPSLFLPVELAEGRGPTEAGLVLGIKTPLQDLGLRQLTLGTTTFAATAEPRGPVRYGRHRLRFQLRHWVASTTSERHFVRIAAPSSSP